MYAVGVYSNFYSVEVVKGQVVYDGFIQNQIVWVRVIKDRN